MMTITTPPPTNLTPASPQLCHWCQTPTEQQQLTAVKITRSMENPPPPESVETWQLCPECYVVFEKM
jgi:hypothetical protein